MGIVRIPIYRTYSTGQVYNSKTLIMQVSKNSLQLKLFINFKLLILQNLKYQEISISNLTNNKVQLTYVNLFKYHLFIVNKHIRTKPKFVVVAKNKKLYLKILIRRKYG